VLISDTVGFVKNLPHQLIESFKATLEETVNADLLVHIIDVSNPDVLNQIESVNKVLMELGCREKTVLEVFNKVDIVKKISDFEMLQTLFPKAVCISAKTGFGLDVLCNSVTARFRGEDILIRVAGSHPDGKIQSYLHAHGQIVDEQYHGSSFIIDARLGRNLLPELLHLHPETFDILRDG
jgi:GTP-binding protein HflX